MESIYINPPDEATKKHGRLVTRKGHTAYGGLGNAVCAGMPVPVRKIGRNDLLGQSARSDPDRLTADDLGTEPAD